jgi:hypothetical protein
MRKNLDEVAVERIWGYNIYPFIEDQLFGEPERIARYRYAEVRKRFRQEVATEPEVDDAVAVEGGTGDEG